MFLFLFSSIRSNLLNNFEISSGFIPIPVSIISMRSFIFLSAISLWAILKVILPSFVYFTALISRFVITCLIRISSPYKEHGNSGEKSV